MKRQYKGRRLLTLVLAIIGFCRVSDVMGAVVLRELGEAAIKGGSKIVRNSASTLRRSSSELAENAAKSEAQAAKKVATRVEGNPSTYIQAVDDAGKIRWIPESNINLPSGLKLNTTPATSTSRVTSFGDDVADATSSALKLGDDVLSNQARSLNNLADDTAATFGKGADDLAEIGALTGGKLRNVKFDTPNPLGIGSSPEFRTVHVQNKLAQQSATTAKKLLTKKATGDVVEEGGQVFAFTDGNLVKVKFQPSNGIKQADVDKAIKSGARTVEESGEFVLKETDGKVLGKFESGGLEATVKGPGGRELTKVQETAIMRKVLVKDAKPLSITIGKKAGESFADVGYKLTGPKSLGNKYSTLIRQDVSNVTELGIKQLDEAANGWAKKEWKAAPLTRKLGRAIKGLSKIGGKGLLEKVMLGGAVLFITSIAFSVPNTIFQAQQEKEQRHALYETVASPQPFGNLWLQIPPSLVLKGDASQSKFIYLEIPDRSRRGGAYFTEAVLNEGKYYAPYAGEFQDWATTYLGGPTFGGSMINLNNGWLFTGNGISVDDMRPTFPLRPRGTRATQSSTVEAFLNQMVAVAGQKEVVHWTTVWDWAFGAKRANVTHYKVDDERIKKLFATPDPTPSALADATGFTPLPPLLYATAAAFRQTRKLEYFGGVKLRQLQGTGFLNRLLSVDIDWNDPKNQSLYDKVRKLNDAQMAYNRAALGGYRSKDELAAREKDLQAAQNAIAALDISQIGGSGGLHPQEDINMYGCYVYEIVTDEDGALTPSLDFLLHTKPCVGLPIAEYVVCLDASGNIVPLLVPRVVQKALTDAQVVTDSAGKIQDDKNKSNKNSNDKKSYTVELIINPRIAYLTSLTTGLTYTSNNTGMLGAPVMQKDKITPDFTFAQRACTALMGKLYEVSQKGTPVMGALSQLVSMSNYVAKAATAGPFKLENGYQLERVPLAAMLDEETMSNSPAAQAANLKTMSNLLAGITDWVTPAINVPDATRSEWLKYMSVYKVSMAGCNGAGVVGALSYVGADGKIVDIPDYVVAVAPSSDKQSQTIVPLGLNNITGSSASSDTQYILSLVTGRVYDVNYNPYVPFKLVEVPDRTYTTSPAKNIAQQLNINIAAKPGWKTKTFPMMNPDSGKMEDQTLPYVEAPIATAYMPTAFNPYNRVFQNTQDKAAYDKMLSALNDAKKKELDAAAAVNTALGFKSSSVISAAIFDTYREAIASNADFVTLFNQKFSGGTAQMAQNVQVALKAYFDATRQYYALWSQYTDMQAKIDTGVIPTSARAVNSQLYIPPLYFGLFSRFSVVDKGGFTLQAVPADASGKQDDNLTWVNTQVTTSAKPVALLDDYGKVQAWVPLLDMFPKKFIGYDLTTTDGGSDITYYPGSSRFPSILNAYSAWEASQSSNYWATNVYMGPFNFTSAAMAQSDRVNLSNVFITPTSRADVANRNYFYRATGFDQADIFVLGRALNPDKPVQSISDLKDIGKPFVAPGGKDYYLINLGTGYVYTPYAGQSSQPEKEGDAPVPIEDPSRCLYTKDAAGNLVNEVVSGVASTQKWWSLQQAGKQITAGGQTIIVPLRLDPAQVLQAVLKNTIVKGKTATIADLTPTLRALIASSQLVSSQLMQQNLYPYYFNNQFTLALRQDQITNGSYVYGVVNKGESYLDASDYLVACIIDEDGSIVPVPTPLSDYTASMVSLVSGTVYDIQLGTLREAYTTDLFSDPETGELAPGYPRGNPDITISEVPDTIVAQLPQLASDLMGVINDLNQRYSDTKQKTAAVEPDVNAVPLDITKLTPVSTDEASVYSDIYKLSENGKIKYFAKEQVPAFVPDATQQNVVTTSIDTYFDFKGTPLFNDAQQASDYGVLYYVDPVTKKASARSITVGYELQAMRLHSGVYVGADGTQRLGIPLGSISLPKADNETTLVSKIGENGTYMRCLTNFGIIDDATHNASYTYYQHTALNAVLAAVKDKGLKVTDPKFTKNASGNLNSQLVTNPDMFVDLCTGDAYDTTGAPQRAKIAMAFKHLRPRPTIFTYSGVKAAPLPVEALRAATPNQAGLCQVNGKYYVKLLSVTPVVDKNGQIQTDQTTGTQRLENTVRYFDFNASRTESNPKSDTGMGIWYQISKDDSGKEIGVAIDDTWQDDPDNLDGRYLTDMRAYYGVRVANDGTQRLIDPITTGVDFQRIFFVWGNKSIFEDEFNVKAMYHDGANYDVYDYVPLSRYYGFTNADGSVMYEYGYAPDSTEDAIKIQCITTANNKKTVSILTAKTLEDALQTAVQSGQLLYAITYTLSAGIDEIVVTESALTPRTFTIADDANEYLEIVRTANYQTAWPQEGPGTRTEQTITADVAKLEFIGDTFTKGIPFVAQSIGARLNGTEDELDPALTTGFIAGIMNEKGGLLAFTSDAVINANGEVRTQLFYAPYPAIQGMIAPGKILEYYSLLGSNFAVAAQTSNYPVISNPETGKPINQGMYITLIRNGVTYDTNKIEVNDYLYRFVQESVSDSQLDAMQSLVNVVSTTNGATSLVGAFALADVRAIQLDGMPNTVGYITTPEKRVLYRVADDASIKQLYANDTRVFYDRQNNEISAYQNYRNAFEEYPAGTYIDYTDGTVFMPSTADSKIMYPIGSSVSLGALTIIHDQFGNAVAYTGGDKPVLLSPEQYYSLSKTLTPTDNVTDAKNDQVTTIGSAGATGTTVPMAGTTAVALDSAQQSTPSVPVVKTATATRTIKAR